MPTSTECLLIEPRYILQAYYDKTGVPAQVSSFLHRQAALGRDPRNCLLAAQALQFGEPGPAWQIISGFRRVSYVSLRDKLIDPKEAQREIDQFDVWLSGLQKDLSY